MFIDVAAGCKFRKGLITNTQIVFSFRFNNQSGLYTRGLGTVSKIDKDNPYFDDYAYLLDLHPDWDNLYINNQIS